MLVGFLEGNRRYGTWGHVVFGASVCQGVGTEANLRHVEIRLGSTQDKCGSTECTGNTGFSWKLVQPSDTSSDEGSREEFGKTHIG